jgi:hypothetical protein
MKKIKNAVLKIVPQSAGRKFCENAINAYIAKINRTRVSKITGEEKEVFLNPILFGGGNVEHYYHFVFDLILPLSLLLKESSANCNFYVEEFGPFSERVQELFPGRVKTIKASEIHQISERHPICGMNPTDVFLSHSTLQEFCFNIGKCLQIEEATQANKIILIERLPPSPYFLNNAKIKGAGASRRSIHNHHKLAETLSSMVKEPFEFHNLRLEELSFQEQVDYFSKACIVIGQHGAGLANCIWMKPHSTVVEFSSDLSKNHFRIISRIKKHKYSCYKTSADHTVIEPDDFVSWISGNDKLRRYFNI